MKRYFIMYGTKYKMYSVCESRKEAYKQVVARWHVPKEYRKFISIVCLGSEL